MDEQQLNDILSAVKAPAPDESRKNQALLAAMAAFEENFTGQTQGAEEVKRPTDMQEHHVRRFFMNKPRYLSGPVGAVALIALVAVLGTSFYTHEADFLIGTSSSKEARDLNAAQVKIDNVSSLAPDMDAAKAITPEGRRKAAEVARQNGSATPSALSTGSAQTLAAPALNQPAQPAEKQKAEALDKKADAAAAPAPEAPQADAINVIAPTSSVVAGRIQGKPPVAAPVPAPGAAGASPMMADELSPLAKDAEKKGLIEDKTVAVPMPVPASPPAQNVISAAPNVVPLAPNVMPAPAMRAVPMPPNDYQAYYQAENRDAFPDFKDNAVTEVAADPVSTFSIDVDTSSYSFVRKMINQGALPPKGAVRLEEMINYFPYNYALPAKGEDPFRPTVAVYKAPWNPDHKLVHIGIKGYDLETKPQSNLVFLIDTSGSMNSPERLPLIISSFKLMLDSLKPDDMISIVTYAGNAGVALEPTKASDKAKIIDVLDRLQASGSTAGAEGIRTAYDLAQQNFIKDGNNRVLLATDGDFNVGISNPDDLKNFIAQKRGEGIFLSVLGVGQGNYQDATMQSLAQNGNGNASYIDTLSEARKVLVEEAGSTLFTIAKDVKIQVEFNPATVQEYRLIGYETRHLNREDFNNDKVDAGEVGAGHAVTAIYEITPVGAPGAVDPLRYEKDKKPTRDITLDKSEKGDEYAFLKIRYKKPDSDKSTLMTRAITHEDDKSFDALPDDLRFASAVAGFGQLLRGSDQLGSFSYDDVIAIANAAKDKDEYGYRAEFVNLARLAKSESGSK